MKYKVGDKVRIVSERTRGMVEPMDKWLGKIMTIREVGRTAYKMAEDAEHWLWNDGNIVGLAEWEVEYTKDDLKAGYKVRLRPLDECKARDEESIWVDSMDLYAGNEVTVRHLNTLGFNVEGTHWNFPYGAIESIVSYKPKKKEKVDYDSVKIGDEVRLKPIKQCKKTRGWVNGMDGYAGGVVTVRERDPKCFRIEGSTFYFDYACVKEIIGTEPSPMPVEDTFKLLFGFE